MSNKKDYKVVGNLGNDAIKGIVQTYPENIKEAASKGSKCSVLSSLKTNNKNIKYGKKEVLKKVALALTVGQILFVSLPGCSLANKKEIVIQTDQDYRVKIEYNIKEGDSLWKIASLYAKDIQNEINLICILNNIKEEDYIYVGDTLSLEIPFSSPGAFYKEIENIKWNSMDLFINTAINDESIKNFINKNHIELTRNEIITMQGELDSEKKELYVMRGETSIFPKEALQEKEEKIDNIYKEIIKYIEMQTKYKFNFEDSIEQYQKQKTIKTNNITK